MFRIDTRLPGRELGGKADFPKENECRLPMSRPMRAALRGTAFYINFRKKTLDNIKTARKA